MQLLAAEQGCAIALKDVLHFLVHKVVLDHQSYPIFLRRLTPSTVELYQLFNNQGIKEQYYL